MLTTRNEIRLQQTSSITYQCHASALARGSCRPGKCHYTIILYNMTNI